jgi:prophage regulatory protein
MTAIYLSDAQVGARYGVHKTTPWRWAKTDSAFPKPVKLSPQCTRWRLSEIEAWEAAKNKSDAA